MNSLIKFIFFYFLMNKISQFHTINENSSQDKLIQFFTLDQNKNKQTPLIDRINQNKLEIKKINLIEQPFDFNKENTNSNSNRSQKDIYFDDCIQKKSITLDDIDEKENQVKKKRKSIFERIEYNPLSAIDSLKQLKIYEDKTMYGKNVNKIKICEIFLGLFSLISILLGILDNEFYIKNTRKFIKPYIKDNILDINSLKQIGKRKISKLENYIRILNGILSIILCIVVIIKYKFYLIGEKINKRLSEYDGFKSAGYTIYIIIECMICIIFYPPFLNITFFGKSINNVFVYSLNSILLPFNILKGYNLVLLIIFQSRYNSNISKTICDNYKIEADTKFIIRSEINSKMLRNILYIMIIFCSLLSALSRYFEIFSFDINTYLEGKKGLNDLQNYINNYWLTLITVLNVAFGDEYTRTNLGRFINFIVCVIGIVSIGMSVATITDKLEFDINEKKAYLKLKKVFSPKNTQNKAANVIKTILLIAKNGKEKIINRSKHFREKTILLLKIKAETKIFKNELLVSRVYSMPINDLIKTMETKLYDNLLDVTTELDKINFIEDDFKLIRKNQDSISQKLKTITYFQNCISKIISENHNLNYLKNKSSNKTLDEINFIDKNTILINKADSKKKQISPSKIKKIILDKNKNEIKKKKGQKNLLSPKKMRNIENKVRKNFFLSQIEYNKIIRSNSAKTKSKMKLENISPNQKNRKKKILYNGVQKKEHNKNIKYKNTSHTNLGIKNNIEKIKPRRNVIGTTIVKIKKNKL